MKVFTTSLRHSLPFEDALVAASNFADLVQLMHGVHPIELLDRVRSFRSPAKSLENKIRLLIDDAERIEPSNAHPQGKDLALPHPIDAEWRFTDETARDLLESAVAATKPGETILLMGVPSVVVAALQSEHDRHFMVQGEANIITTQLRVLSSNDLRFDHDAVEGRDAAAAILDPPWYVEQFCGMLKAASARCCVGAQVFVSAPLEGVRPSITKDLFAIDEAAWQCGLELVEKEAGVLRYSTPFFELNALRASGVGIWLPQWRRANLRVYRKRANASPFAFETPDVVGFELTLSGVRLRLLAGQMSESAFSPLYEDEIFPSVSRRAPRRSEATLWTTGNRAFALEYSAGLTALVAIASDRRLLPERLDSGLSIHGNAGAVDRAYPLIQKLLDLADRELAEAASLLGPAAWNTAANDARFLGGSPRVSR